MQSEQRLRFRDAMASLSAAVNVITTEGETGRCGITATAVCSVTDTPPSLMVCINANSAMNPVFQAMEERFALSCWQNGALAQPVLKGALASLEGEISQVQTIGTHLVYLVEIKNIILSDAEHGLIYFKRRFHPVMMETEAAV